MILSPLRVAASAVAYIVGGLPLVGVAGLVWWARVRRGRRPVAEPDPLIVAQRLLVLVGAGLPILPALERAGADSPRIQTLVRRSRREGGAVALSRTDGDLAPLLAVLARGLAAGASPEPAIRSYIVTERRSRHTAQVERARRLPIRLMLPMTLLVLPGFVLLVYGPAFVEVVVEMLGPLGP